MKEDLKPFRICPLRRDGSYRCCSSLRLLAVAGSRLLSLKQHVIFISCQTTSTVTRSVTETHLRVHQVVLDLLLGHGDVLQDDLQPHGHHAGHPVHQAGADVARHPPLEHRAEFTSGASSTSP